MRFSIMLAAAPVVLAVTTGLDAPRPHPAPFAVAPVGDDLLAGVVGTGTPWRVRTRLSDDLSMSALRQTASVGGIVKDMWLIDVASPLIAANVRAAQVR